MQAPAWLLTVALAYATALLWLALGVDALRRRRWGELALTALLPPAALYLGLNLLPAGTWQAAGALAAPLVGLGGRYRALARSSAWKEARSRRQRLRQVALHLVLVTGAVVFVMPFVWLLSTSLKPDRLLMVIPPQWVPRPTLWSNYARALEFLPPETHHGLMYLWNTVYVSGLTILGVVLSSSLVAYSFARLRWPGRDLFFVVLLSSMMLPGAVTMVPVFLIFKWLGWVDTLRPLWVPAFFGSAFNIFLLRQFFLTIPMELEDAAKIDGAPFWVIYSRIMLPLVKPALAAVVIWTFMGAWNNFMGPLIYISSPEKMPVAYALQLYQSAHGSEYNLLMAAATLVVLPVIALFFFTQRYFIQGVTLTGIKG